MASGGKGIAAGPRGSVLWAAGKLILEEQSREDQGRRNQKTGGQSTKMLGNSVVPPGGWELSARGHFPVI